MTEELYGIDPSDVETLVRKIESASDNYAKMDVFEQFDVDWGDRKKALWALVRHGHYKAWNDPAIWYELVEAIDHASAEDIVKLLENVTAYDAEASGGGDDPSAGAEAHDDYGYDPYGYGGSYDYGGYEEPAYESPRLVSFWPQYLDTLAMKAYALDSELVESRIAEFSGDVQKGMQLVRARFGVEAAEVPEETVTELANTHVWNSLPWAIFVADNDELLQLELGDQEKGPENQRRFLSTFADEDTWAQAVLDAIFKEDYGPSFSSTLPAWGLASLEQVAWMVSNISLYNQERVRAMELVLGREDAAGDLLEVAREFADDSKSTEAEFFALAAIHRALDDGEAAPADALEYITFQNLDNPHNRNDFFSLPLYTRALQAYGVDTVRRRFEQRFDSDYGKVEAMPAVVAFKDDDALLNRAFEAVNTFAAEDGKRFSSMNKAAFGLGLLGVEKLDQLVGALEASDVPLARDTFRRAIIGVLADAGEPQHEKYDEYVTLNFDSSTDLISDHDLGHYVSKDFAAAVSNMGEERAMRRLADELDASNASWHRALPAVAALSKPELFDKAFGVIAQKGLPPTDGYNWFQPLVAWELRDTIQPFVGPALAASKSPEFHNAIKNALGEDAYEQMLDEAGGESAADAGQAGKIQRLADAWFGANPEADRSVIYVMERNDDAPEEGTLNRIGGRPFGVTAENWPSKDADNPMTHMFTVDLDMLPAFRQRYNEDVRAISLYVNSPNTNKAWTPGNADSEVVHVMRGDADLFEGDLPIGDEQAVGFTVSEVEVPVGAFTVPYDGDAELRQIKSAIYSAPCWAGGSPIWLQGEDYFGLFFLQFDESFAYMNLGDCGIMYVFDDTAFWQCH